jgi:hypothetical protein
MPENKETIIQAVVDYIKSEELEDIRARIVGYSDPAKIVWNTSGKGYVPDITAAGDGNMFIFEVQHPDSDLSPQIDKWRLFTTFSRKTKGNFYIVGMADQEYTIKNLLYEHRIDAQVLTVK